MEHSFQGANLSGTQFQGTLLYGAQLHGVSCKSDDFDTFAQRMRSLIGQESDLSDVTFEGGIRQEDLDSIVKGLSDEKANDLRNKLESHIDKPKSNQPKYKRAETGAYTEEEADKWIAEIP